MKRSVGVAEFRIPWISYLLVSHLRQWERQKYPIYGFMEGVLGWAGLQGSWVSKGRNEHQRHLNDLSDLRVGRGSGSGRGKGKKRIRRV